MSSLIDFTLKFLNDDMAINHQTNLRVQDPLIEKSVEDDFAETQLHKLPKHNQAADQFDGKSSIFSHGGSNPNLGEINLKKINNIYTSPFFLINSSKNEQHLENENVYKIWENFDKINNALTFQKSEGKN